MSRYSNLIWVSLAFSIALAVGLLLEYKFSIVQKIKSSLVTCQNSCNAKENIKITVDELNLIISDSALAEIKTQRQNAIDGNRDFSFLDAKMVNNGDTVLIQARLKGDRAIHFNDETKWSFRVKTIDGKSIFIYEKIFQLLPACTFNVIKRVEYLLFSIFINLHKPL